MREAKVLKEPETGLLCLPLDLQLKSQEEIVIS